MGKRRIILIGNHLSSFLNYRTVIEELSSRLIENGWEVINTSDKKNRIIRLVDMITTIIYHRKSYNIALIDVFSGQAFIWAFISGWLLRLLKKPFLLMLHGGNLPNFALSYPHFVKKLFTWANAIYSPSPFLKEKLSSFYPHIKIIPNTIEIENYDFRPRNQISPKLVWLRAFHEIYNPSMIPKVLSILLNSKCIKFEILMVGPDKGDGSLQRMTLLAKQLKVDQLIKIVLGVSKEKVPIYLNQGDIFINSTNIDNSPVSVIEAMACGLCIVSTNVGGIPYLLEHEVDALLVPPDDPETMAAAIQRILTEPDLAARLSTNARKKAEQFDWSIILPQWEALFAEVLQDNL